MFFDWMVFCGTKNGSSMASLEEPFKGTQLFFGNKLIIQLPES